MNLRRDQAETRDAGAGRRNTKSHVHRQTTKTRKQDILVMSLLDKVSGELNIYIGGYVT